MKTYTIGEILRGKLLKNHHGEPYKHKATIIKLLQKASYKRVKTPYGLGYAITEADIKKLNKRFD